MASKTHHRASKTSVLGSKKNIQSQIAKVRKDFLDKESTKLSDHYAMIAIDDLKIKNMSASAKGNLDEARRR